MTTQWLLYIRFCLFAFAVCYSTNSQLARKNVDESLWQKMIENKIILTVAWKAETLNPFDTCNSDGGVAATATAAASTTIEVSFLNSLLLNKRNCYDYLGMTRAHNQTHRTPFHAMM